MSGTAPPAPAAGPAAAATRASFRGGTADPGFIWLNVTQFLGAFNDKGFMTLISLHLSATYIKAGASGGSGEGDFYIMLSTALFILPFVLFSTWCGHLADRFSKRDVMLAVKAVEIALMALGTLAFWLGSVKLVFAALLLLGVHSTLFSPAKYGILPEILAPEHLSHGNGIIELLTFVSIIAGTVAATLAYERLAERAWIIPLVYVGLALLGLLAASRIPRVPAAGVHGKPRLNFLADVAADTRRIAGDRALLLTILAVTWFWFLATAMNNNLFTFAKEAMGLPDTDKATIGYLLVALSLGIGFGSGLAGKLSGEIVEFGLVPLGSIGMTLFLFALAHAAASPWSAGGALFCLGLSGGLFIVPLHAYMQERAPAGETGKVIALANFYANVATIGSSLCIFLLHDKAGLSPPAIYLLTALLTLAATAAIVAALPDFLVRLVLFPLTRTVYRLRRTGTGRLPREGAAILVANHAALSDAFVLQATTHRPIRFLIDRAHFGRPLVGPFLRLMRAIPVDPDDPGAEAAGEAEAALARGELVGLFPEGGITPDGSVGPFRPHYAALARRTGRPVIPAALRGMWGSIFSRAGGAPAPRLPRRLPYPVEVAFGEPLPPERAEEAREALLALLPEAAAPREVPA